MRRDLVFGSATLAVSVVYYLMADAIQPSQLADAIGPQGLPKIYALILAGLSLVLVGRGIRDRERDRGSGIRDPGGSGSRDPRGSGSPVPNPRFRLWRAAGMLLIGVLYLAVVPWLGYLLSISGVILATAYYQGGAFSRQSAVVAIGGGILFWVLFVLLMGIAQPPGWFPPAP